MSVFSPSDLAEFYQTPLGQQLYAQEQTLLQQLVADWVGYDLVVLGQPVAPLTCAIRRQWHLASFPTPAAHAQYDGVQLPLATDSVDAVILRHELAFSPDGDALLEDIARVLIPEGRVIVLGMNPLAPGQLGGPWTSAGLTQQRLAQAMLRPTHCAFVGNGLLQTHRWRRQWAAVATRYAPWLQRSYAVVAVKRVIRLTLIRPRWSMQPVGLGVAVPSRRLGVWRQGELPAPWGDDWPHRRDAA